MADAHERAMRWALFGFGMAMSIVGGVAVCRGWSQLQITAPLVTGSLFLVIGLFAQRITSISATVGGSSIKADMVAAIGKAVVEDLEQAGIAGLIDAYGFVHDELQGDEFRSARVHLQDALLKKVRATTLAHPPSPDGVRRLLESGSLPERVLALGFLYGDPTLRTVPALVPAILRPLSGNEQFHALVLARDTLRQLNEDERTELAAAVRDRPYAGDDHERDVIASQILSGAGAG